MQHLGKGHGLIHMSIYKQLYMKARLSLILLYCMRVALAVDAYTHLVTMLAHNTLSSSVTTCDHDLLLLMDTLCSYVHYSASGGSLSMHFCMEIVHNYIPFVSWKTFSSLILQLAIALYNDTTERW